MDPSPDYDVSDELEYGLNWFAWSGQLSAMSGELVTTIK
jgi:hypothetical protein